MSLEAFEQLRDKQRQAKRQAFQPQQVHSYEDIQRLVAELDPAQQRELPPVEVGAILEGKDEKDQDQSYQVSALTSQHSKRQLLLDGMAAIRRRQEVAETAKRSVIPILVNGQEMTPPPLAVADQFSYIDPLIQRWLGAQRDGQTIYWELSDGYRYNYDVHQHKLTRIRRS